ncbi:hypothetical protein [Mucilaginibacter corticis]|uniref:hypothetical protein n=1 Tax=Mucilaginibacter corticis TaxID=2597670 RepID=UPI0016425368|nr:hypothetical protein [Mucilaginibacter corticis]
MKTQKINLMVSCLAALMISFSSCSKSTDVKPGANGTGNTSNTGTTGNPGSTGNTSNTGTGNTGNTGNTGSTGSTGNQGNSGGGKHVVDAKLVGTWLWTQGSDAAYYDANGTYVGDAYGFATQFTIKADGTGSCYMHLYSSLGPGSTIVVDISSTGFFETDSQGHLGYFPTAGTYESSNSGSRNLYPSELYDEANKSGKVFLYQDVKVTSQGGRNCYTTTASDGTVDTYFKVN